jgi:predicted N-acyltransferase
MGAAQATFLHGPEGHPVSRVVSSPDVQETTRTACRYRLFESIEDVDLAAWERVRIECGGSVFLDPRFIAAIETSMKRNCRFQYVIVYDDDGRPLACTCVTGITIDLADFVGPKLAWMIRGLPSWLRRLRFWKLMYCGLPVATGHHALVIAPRVVREPIVSLVDGVVEKLASEMGADAVVYREFEQDDLGWISPLLNRGYRHVPTPPAHFFRSAFRNLEDYCAALKSHYRKQIKRSLRKLEEAGITTRVLSKTDEIVQAYTPAVHSLYHQMYERADTKFEMLSIEFLHEMARRIGDHVNLIMLDDGSKVVAFGWCLATDKSYHMMYAGLDYGLNEELDLYFNLHYAALGCALRRGVSRIELGLAADSFKARLGCYSEPLHIFLKGRGPLTAPMVRFGSNLLFAPTPPIPPFEVFKNPM